MTSELIDSFGRVHKDLRVSLTDKCNLRCTYCMPAEGVEWLPSQHILNTNELNQLLKILCDLGITEIRLTGGEPLLRPDILEIIENIPLQVEPNPHNAKYLNTKKLKMGHSL